MTKHPRLVRRGNRFYYRRRVPKDLVAQFTPSIRIALRTSDWTLAVALCRRYDADFDIRFAQATARTKPLPILQPLSLSDTDIAAICDRYLADALHTDDESRALGYMQPLFEIFKVGDAQVAQGLSKMLAVGQLSGLAETCFETGMQAMAMDLSRLQQTDLMRLRYAFLRTLTRYFSVRSQRNEGQVILTQSVVSIAPSQTGLLDLSNSVASSITLTELHTYWAEARTRPAKTIEDYGRIAEKFAAFAKEERADSIEKKHVIAYRDHLLKESLHHKTVGKYVSYLFTLFEYAVQSDRLPRNPVAGVTVPRPHVVRKSRVPYDAADLQTIFDGPVYTKPRFKCASPLAAKWLPLLAAFTGARIEELCQLKGQDVREEKGHGWVISIRGERLKTSGSLRDIPLHPKLVEAGFLRFCATRPAAEFLFDLAPDPYGSLSAAIGKWWGRYCRGVLKITDPRKVFHSFRHGFKEACRRGGISLEIHDALTGHTSPGVGAGYGGETFPIEPLIAAIHKVEYPELRVPKIC